MKQTSDFAQAQAFTGESERLPIGGHICVIRSAKCEIARSGKEMLVLALDIKEGGEFDGFYSRRFENAKNYNADAKWPCIYRSTTENNEGKTNPMFKGLINAIEESNSGYKWNWNELSLKGLLIGFNFGEEEYKSQNTGEIRTTIRPRFPSSTAKVREGLTPPEIKKLSPGGSASAYPTGKGFIPVDDDDELPF